jgi:hypothetical protein
VGIFIKFRKWVGHVVSTPVLSAITPNQLLFGLKRVLSLVQRCYL